MEARVALRCPICYFVENQKEAPPDVVCAYGNKVPGLSALLDPPQNLPRALLVAYPSFSRLPWALLLVLTPTAGCTRDVFEDTARAARGHGAEEAGLGDDDDERERREHWQRQARYQQQHFG